MYLIDTNIFLEFLLGQNRKDECVALFNKVISGILKANVSRFSIYSIEIALSRNRKTDALKNFLAILRNSRGLKLLYTDYRDDEQIIELMKVYKLDFDDALHCYLCNIYNLKIISYDKHFDKTPIKRLEPSEINL